MFQSQTEIAIETTGVGLFEFTARVSQTVAQAGITTGIAHLFCRHTSASLVIQENADPDVQRDLVAFFRRLVPDGDRLFVHTAEGPDDMPAHVKAALTQTAIAIPIAQGRLMLGTWQGIYLFEHRSRPHSRNVVIHLSGE